ncbi:MAG: helix-turn-helix domain-containing protein [Acidimicrobiia bacterium]
MRFAYNNALAMWNAAYESRMI